MARRAANEPERQVRPRHRKGSIWNKPNIKVMLEEPLGSPVSLTREEALAIVRESFGKRPDLPPGDEYVRLVRPVWAGLLRRRHG